MNSDNGVIVRIELGSAKEDWDIVLEYCEYKYLFGWGHSKSVTLVKVSVFLELIFLVNGMGNPTSNSTYTQKCVLSID
jgi:hypothetical protein